MIPLRRREFLKVSGLLLAGALISNLAPKQLSAGIERSTASSTMDNQSPSVLWRGNPNLPQAALTFDDCYDYELLLKLETILDGYAHVRVTFFPVGLALLNTATKDAGIWKRLLEKGHAIGCHSYNHDQPSLLSVNEAQADYELWLGALEQAVGYTPTTRLYRPPFGELSYSFLNVCEKNGLIAAMWSTNWGVGPEKLQKEMPLAQNGEIALLHIRWQDIENVSAAIAFLEKRQLQVVTLEEMVDMAAQPLPTPTATPRSWPPARRPRQHRFKDLET